VFNCSITNPFIGRRERKPRQLLVMLKILRSVMLRTLNPEIPRSRKSRPVFQQYITDSVLGRRGRKLRPQLAI